MIPIHQALQLASSNSVSLIRDLILSSDFFSPIITNGFMEQIPSLLPLYFVPKLQPLHCYLSFESELSPQLASRRWFSQSNVVRSSGAKFAWLATVSIKLIMELLVSNHDAISNIGVLLLAEPLTGLISLKPPACIQPNFWERRHGRSGAGRSSIRAWSQHELPGTNRPQKERADVAQGI